MAATGKVLGTVTSVVGEVKATAADGTVRILQVGDQVFSDEVINTTALGSVNIALDNGKTLDCGGDTELALHESILGVATAASPATAAPGSDVAALQAAIAGGADPSQVAQATAAGGAPAAGGGVDGGGGTPVIIDQANTTGVVTSGFPTAGDSLAFGAPEFQLLPVQPVPAVVTVTLINALTGLEADSVVEGQVITLRAVVDVAPTGTPLVLTLSPSDTLGDPSDDFRVEIPVGQTVGTFSFAAPSDDPYVDRGPQTYTVVSAEGGGFDSLTIGNSSVTIFVEDTIDTTRVLLATSDVNEDDASVTFTATLSNPAQTPVTITTNLGEIQIAAGETQGTLVVNTADPDVHVDPSSITATVSAVSGGNFERVDFSEATATAQIADTIDTTTVLLATSDVTEDDASVTFTVTLSNPAQTPVTITTNLGEIQIAAGETQGTLVVNTADPDVYVDPSSITATVSAVSGGNFEAVDFSGASATAQISDTIDQVTATLTATPSEISETGGSITYTVTLTGAPGAVDPDTNLVFNLANGEQVTILAGATSGSVTKTFTDDDITSQPSITNNIASIASGGSEYEHLVTTGTVTTDIDFGAVISGLKPQIDGGDVTVDEDDLLASRGLNESAGSDTTKESTTQPGTFNISAPDGVDALTIGGHAVITNGAFEATSFTTDLGNTLSITGYDPDSGVVTYSYTLVDNATHASGDGENELFENFAVLLTDQDGDSDTDTLSVRIVDDVPSVSFTNSIGSISAEDQIYTGLWTPIVGADSVTSIDDLVSVVLNNINVGDQTATNLVFTKVEGDAEHVVYNGSFDYDSNPGDGVSLVTASFTLTLSKTDGGAYQYQLDLGDAVQSITITGDDFVNAVDAGGPTPSLFIEYFDTATGAGASAIASVGSGEPVDLSYKNVEYSNVILSGAGINARSDFVGIDNNNLDSFVGTGQDAGTLFTERLIYDPGTPATTITLEFKEGGTTGWGLGGGEDVLHITVFESDEPGSRTHSFVLDSRDPTTDNISSFTISLPEGWTSMDRVEVTPGFYATDSGGIGETSVKIGFGFSTETEMTVDLPVKFDFAGTITDADGDTSAVAPFSVTTVAGTVFQGNDGSDFIVGTAGDDVIIGGAGNDIVDGGTGSDTFKFSSSTDGVDSITSQFTIGTGAEADTLNLHDVLSSNATLVAAVGQGASGADVVKDFIYFEVNGATATLHVDTSGQHSGPALATFAYAGTDAEALLTQLLQNNQIVV